MTVHILEIGPGSSPARNFIQSFSDAAVTFVGAKAELAKFSFEEEFPGSKYFAVGFLYFVDNIASPDTFDYVIASNVLNLPFERIDAKRLVVAAAKILRHGGTLIIEHTLDQNGDNIGRKYEQIVRESGFNTNYYYVNQRPAPPEIRMHFVNTHVIDANGRGFSLHAKKR